MTDKKPTPTQRVKELETEVKELGQFILDLNKQFEEEIAKHGNEQYGLGLQQGRAEMSAAFEAQTRIQRWMYKA